MHLIKCLSIDSNQQNINKTLFKFLIEFEIIFKFIKWVNLGKLNIEGVHN